MIIKRELTYDVDGLKMVAHLAHPKDQGAWPAVLIGHDGIGLDDYQRSRADELAARGYIALAMDYHGGQSYFGRPSEMLARIMPLMADDRRMQTIGRAALDHLLAIPGADPRRLAALGYGAGGRIVLELARTGVPFKSIAVVHPGLPAVKAKDWTNVASTLLLCTGSEDPICTPDQVLKFGRALQDSGIDWRVNIYGGAKHAFWARQATDDGDVAHAIATVPGVGYHPKHAARAWQAVLDLFGETLSRPESERAAPGAG
ncbi:MAG: dienelactone hydrolase family protein [Bdellovibrionaceae bacterium]|nr:dienelactone hydrolase family protein [Pseudobdellovibrionaceae bacterium]